MIQETHLHPLDVAILRELQNDGRISNVELARHVHLSPPATHARVRRLENDGYRVVNPPRRTGDGYYESVVFDPDGNRIEITV